MLAFRHKHTQLGKSQSGLYKPNQIFQTSSVSAIWSLSFDYFENTFEVIIIFFNIESFISTYWLFVCGKSWQAQEIPSGLTFSHKPTLHKSPLFLYSSISASLFCFFYLVLSVVFEHTHPVHALFLLCYPMAWRLK